MFPVLADRQTQYAASLSGGEQRMLEIARTLVMDPKVIMLDEPSIGLAPRIVDQVFAVVRRLAASGKAILMVEQNVKKALAGVGPRLRAGAWPHPPGGPRQHADRRRARGAALHGHGRSGLTRPIS